MIKDKINMLELKKYYTMLEKSPKFQGDIMVCTKYEKKYYGHGLITFETSEFYEKNVLLIKYKNVFYIDIGSVNSVDDYDDLFKIDEDGNFHIKEININAQKEGDLFIDECSLRPYIKDNEKLQLCR